MSDESRRGRELDRRSFLGLSAAGLGAALTGTLGCATPSRHPNVIFIALDDVNDWVGCLAGHPDTRTPNIDRLAGSGVAFTNAHCQATNCGGSRTGVLTGLEPTTTGVYTNHQSFRPSFPDLVTLPQQFMRHGYRVVGGGKVFHIRDRESWDEFHYPEHVTVDSYSTLGEPQRWANGAWAWGPLSTPVEEMWDGHVARWAVDRLERGFDGPFFMALGFVSPHLPWLLPSEYFEMFPPDQVTLPEVLANDLDDVPRRARLRARVGDHRWLVENDLWRDGVAAYLGTIHLVDAMVGRVLDAVEATSSSEETVVVLWSDHGFHLGEKTHWRKFDLWEESTRVPLIVSAPGRIREDARCGRSVSLVHLYPTLLELCSIPAPGTLDGASLVPLLEDPSAPWERPAITSVHPGAHAVRTERWRYIRYSDGAEELYDHESDPNEWHNLAGDPELADLKRSLDLSPRNPAQSLPRVRPGATARGSDRTITDRRSAEATSRAPSEGRRG